jgi:hypothetical protein
LQPETLEVETQSKQSTMVAAFQYSADRLTVGANFHRAIGPHNELALQRDSLCYVIATESLRG